LLKKAADMDKKYGDELSAVYQQRAYAAANDQRYGDAINDYNEALKLTPQNAARIHEQRAAVEMKIQDYDKALADYSELIKQKPNEIRYLNYRAYIYELKNDLQNSMADNDQILKLDPNNQDSKARKQRLRQKIAEKTPPYPAPRSAHPFPPRAAASSFRATRSYAPIRALASSLSSTGFDTVNFRFRRFAGKGASVMVILRPAISCSVSTCDMLERSSRTFSTRRVPSSWCAISRPRNCS